MAYTASYSFAAPSGLALKWSLVGAGTLHATLRNQTTGFYETGTTGFYEWVASTIPDDFRGVAVFHTNTASALADLVAVTTYGQASINPGEIERAEKLPTYQQVAGIVYRTSGQVHFVSASGASGNDGLTFQPAKALPEQVTMSAGDVMVIGAGQFDATAAYTVPAFTRIVGAGSSTRIVGTGAITEALIRFASNTEASDFSFSAYNGIGPDPTQSVDNITLSRLYALGGTFAGLDGFYYYPADPTYAATNVRLIEGVYAGSADGVASLSGSADTDILVSGSILLAGANVQAGSVKIVSPLVGSVYTDSTGNLSIFGASVVGAPFSRNGSSALKLYNVNAGAVTVPATVSRYDAQASDVTGKVLGGGTATITGVGANANVTHVNGGVVTPVTSLSLTGSGPYAIDHDGGLGAGDVAATLDATVSGTFSAWPTDGLRYTYGGVGVTNLTVRAYEKTAYDASTGSGLAGQASTGSDGRWSVPLNLASGDYYIVADASGDGYQSYRSLIRVP